MCCELENFTLKKLYGVNLYWHFIKSNQVVEHIHNYLIVSCKKLKIISFASSKMKNIGVFPTCFKFPVKLIFVELSDHHQVLVIYFKLLL